MCEATLEDLHQWISSMMKIRGIEHFKVNVSGNSTKGDGYLGEITFVTVETREKGARKNYDIVVKSAKKSDELRKQTPIKEAYDREIFVYTKILPIMKEFQQQKAFDDMFTNHAECYSVSTEIKKEALLLKNLKTVGYDLHDRTKPMDLKHIHLVFKNYARWHALSFALKTQKPALFDSVTRNLTDVLGKFIIQCKLVDVFKANFVEATKLLERTDPVAFKKLDGVERELEKILSQIPSVNTNTSVILHGDCWNNNFMFKYQNDDKSNPTDMAFLDFQLSRLASPVFDLSYFFYCCTGIEGLKHFDSILKAYHSQLSDYVKDLGSDIEGMFPFKKLKEHWQLYGKFGLFMSPFILKIALCDAEEAPDFTDAAEKGEGFNGTFNIEIKNHDLYEERVRNVLMHYANNFL